MKYILGIDAGTTSFKAVLFDQYGRTKAVATKEYELLVSEGSKVEFPTQEYWQVCSGVIREAMAAAKVDPKAVQALAISSQAETLICLDSSGEPLRHAIVWLDNRSIAQADALRQRFGVRRVYDVTGQPEVVATWPATKILWLKEHQNEVFRKTAKFLMLEDFLIHRLTGRYVAEKSLFSSSLLLDIHSGQWWDEMLSALGITSEQLPLLRESGTVVGTLTPEAARATGLDADTVVVTGAMDQIAGMIGAGNIATGIVTETTGTALAMCVTVDEAIPFDPDVKVPCHVHAIPGALCLMFWSQTAGRVLKWFCDNFYDAKEAAGGSIYDVATAQAAAVPAGCEGLVMLPHLSGAACPEFDPYVKGVFSGITLRHGRGHFARAVLESIAFMLNKSMDIVRRLKIPAEEIRSLGGGARSPLWNSIKADVTNLDVITLANPETACLGAAILAGVGCGLFDSVESACNTMVVITQRFRPNPDNREACQRAYKDYLALYDSVKGLFTPASE